MPDVAARRGRPRAADSAARRKHMLRLVTEGHGWLAAAGEARVKAESVLRMLDEPEFAQVMASLLVEHELEQRVA